MPWKDAGKPTTKDLQGVIKFTLHVMRLSSVAGTKMWLSTCDGVSHQPTLFHQVFPQTPLFPDLVYNLFRFNGNGKLLE